MSERRTPYVTHRIVQPLRIVDQEQADAVTILARENHDLKQNIAEVRRILLALVEEIEYQEGPISRPDIELQLQDAREILAKAGLL